MNALATDPRGERVSRHPGTPGFFSRPPRKCGTSSIQSLKIGAILVTRRQTETGHARRIIEALRRAFPDRVFQSEIQHSVRVKDNVAAANSVPSYDPEPLRARPPIDTTYGYPTDLPEHAAGGADRCERPPGFHGGEYAPVRGLWGPRVRASGEAELDPVAIVDPVGLVIPAAPRQSETSLSHFSDLP